MLDEPVAAEQLREAGPVERPARAGAPARARDAQPERGVRGARPLAVAERRVGVGEEQVPDGGRLRGLEVGVVGGEVALRRAGVPRERGDLVEERVVQLARAAAGDEPDADAERLPPRPARAQPARGRAADAPLQLGLAGVEGVAERGIPGELVAGDRVQLEQAAEERLRVVAGEVAALDERDRVREVGEREPAREPGPVRALGRVGGRDELPRGPAAQASAPPQFLALAHRGRE